MRPDRTALKDVALLFLRLGAIAFGGPAAHISMMDDEVVRRRRWLSRAGFLDLLGATNLIPGPNSTEMAMHVGHLRAGWPGLVVAGTCFILPAAVLVTGLAWIYVRFGRLPELSWLLYGMKPVVIAIIAQALWLFTRSAVKAPQHAMIGILAVAAQVLGVNEILVLAAGGAIAGAIHAAGRGAARRGAAKKLQAVALAVPAAGAGAGAGALGLAGSAAAAGSAVAVGSAAVAGSAAAGSAVAAGAAAAGAAPVSLTALFLFFLKVGSILFGSGYVLLAFIRADLVERWHWLTSDQLLDAIAVGQITPGPVSTTATFIGYFLAGPAGAAVATLGMFLPAFVFVALSRPVIEGIRRSRLAGAALDGINVAALGLMAIVTCQLGRSALVDLPTVVVALASLILLTWRRVPSLWLLLGGAVFGWVSILFQ